MQSEPTKRKYERALDFPVTDKIRQRLWSRIDRRGPDECWPWKGSLNSKNGYGRFSVGDRHVAASRALWIIENGPLRPGQVVRHECDHKSCCNPAHLRAGGQSKNMADAFTRGQARFKLTPSDARNIVLLRTERSTRDLAALFGVSPDTINGIVRGRNWGYVTGVGAKVYA